MNNSESLAVLPDRSNGGIARAGLWAGCLLFLYILSIGPAAKLIEKGHVREASVAPFYAPIVWLIDNWKPAREAAEWYLIVVWQIDVYYK